MKRSRSSRHGLSLICLVVFCLFVAIYICVPATAANQTDSHVYLAISQNTTDRLSGSQSKQSASYSPMVTTSATYSGYVGTKWNFEAWQDGFPVGVTMYFQRSEDGINWCTFATAVTGSNGYAYIYGYTETCPGLVYYRALGQLDAFSIQWLPTTPATTCVPIPKCVQKTYSITCIENYDHMGSAGGTLKECNNFANELNDAGYTINFIDYDDSVIPQDFGIDPSYAGHSITGSAFHYHSGHGTDFLNADIPPLEGGWWTYLNLKGYSGFLDLKNKVGAGDVAGKWGGNLKWVMLDSCRTLKDENWHNALTTSHGILGYSNESWVRLDFPHTFMTYALNKNTSKDWTIVSAFKQATLDTYHNDLFIGTVITKTEEQYDKDHFPGVGYMAPDGDPNDNNYFIKHWYCGSGVEW